MDILNKARGCLIGAALGDALGTPLEFKERDTYEHVTGLIGGGPFRLNPGEWTDDTSMSLALAQSLIECNEFDPKDLLDKFALWYEQGHYSHNGKCFDIGNTTKMALFDYLETNQPYRSKIHHMNSGNGSLMRLAGVPIAYRDNPAKCLEVARDQSRTTHGSYECEISCMLYSLYLLNGLKSDDKEKIFNIDYKLIDFKNYPDYLIKSFASILSMDYKDKTRDEIHSSGYVLHSLEAALWSVWNTNSYDSAVLLAANLGDDADTVASITGQLAGALYGLNSINPVWLDTLAWRDKIQNMAESLFHLNTTTS